MKIKELIEWWFSPRTVNQRVMPTFVNPPSPPMKIKYRVAIDLIENAAKFEDVGETDLSNQTLSNLIDYVKKIKS